VTDAGKLLGPAEIRDLAEMLGVTPTKKLGQNFVIDANTVRRIVKTSGVSAGQVAVELDGRLARQLPITVELFQPGAPLTVLHDDALKIEALPHDPTAFVANLPYNVSVPVLLHFLEHFPSIQTGVVMVQSEVGLRLAAPPGSKVYGAPSVKAAWYGKWRTSGSVSRQVFWPVPNVDSILVSFSRDAAARASEDLRVLTFAIVDAAFQQRRKMLRQSVSTVFGSSETASEVLTAAGVDPTARGEQLSVDDFLAVARVAASRA
jgi:16S rRNA (adenine1518-N6/adenine1519-N6)-dimethyltransferase